MDIVAALEQEATKLQKRWRLFGRPSRCWEAE
jgi:hypothetical protein